MSRHSVAASVRVNSTTSQLEHGKLASEYKSSSSSSSDGNTTASFVARPVPHVVGESAADSYAQRQQPIRIVPTSYLLPQQTPATPLHSNVTAFSPVYQSAHPFDVNPLMYDAPPPPQMLHPSLRHYLAGPEHLSMAIGGPFARAMPTAFDGPFHLAPQQPTPANFFEQQAAYEQLYGASYLAALQNPLSIPPEFIAAKGLNAAAMMSRPVDRVDSETKPEIERERETPIDLTTPMRPATSDEDESRMPKPRFPLPLPPVKATYNALDIRSADAATNGAVAAETAPKPWDLRCTLKRKCDDDLDEGISVHNDESQPEKSTPPPAKVVKLFKPYLMSSDDDDDDMTGKNSPKSDDKQKDPIIWSTHSVYDNGNAITPFHVTGAHSPSASESHGHHSMPASYWLNHGSPVSGYDSASSTFSDCNCNDAQCQTKLAQSPAPTVASTFSDDFSVEAPITPTTTTKYMIPRRHILEKWSHEEDDEINQREQKHIVAR